MLKLIRLLFGYCDCCGSWFVYPITRRQSSAYADDSQNFVTCCKRCYEEREQEWAERWREYDSGRL